MTEDRKRVFICSPYFADTYEGIADNVMLATRLCRKAYEEGFAPFAPHLFFPQFLEEGKVNERLDGIKMGLLFLPECDHVWSYSNDNDPTEGMGIELARARKLKKPIRYIQEEELNES